MKKILIVSILAFPFLLFSQNLKRKEISLTVYNQNFALVRDVREVKLEKGIRFLNFDEVASQIDPTSVHLLSLNYPQRLSVLEQNFEYDLLNPEKLLNKYLNKKVEVITKDNNIFQGTLSSFNNTQLIISEGENGPLSMVNRENIRNMIFPKIPEGLIIKPTLVWLLENEKAATHQIELTYMTSGVTWKADYVLELSCEEDKFGLNGWVTIDNRSGATYPDAKLKLVAGDVRKIEERRYRRDSLMMETKAAGAPQFEEKAFFEYHLYTLTRPTVVKNNQTKQISFLSAFNVPVKKIFVYDGALSRWYHYQNWRRVTSNKKVAVNLQFENSEEENNLGVPLPKGKIRVYKKDTDGTSQFIGEDQIDHIPEGEVIKIKVGNAFDLVGDRKITDHKKIASNLYRDSYAITLRNRKKKEKVKIEVVEHLYGDWKILSNSRPFEKEDATTIKFVVEVPAGEEVKITYTAQYQF